MHALAIVGESIAATGRFLLTVIPFFLLGVILAQLFIELRWLDKLSWLARPMMRFGHLHPECAGSFAVAVVSPTAGHTMLARYHSEKRISRTELIIAAIMNALPGYIAQGRSILPVTLPLIGIFGLIYYGLVLFADLVKSLILLVIGGALLPDPGFHSRAEDPAPGAAARSARPSFRQALRNALKGCRSTAPKILKTLVPFSLAAFLLIGFGVFDYVARHIGGIAAYFPVHPNSLPIIAARLISPIGAYTVAGGLLTQGLLSGGDIVAALLVGTLLATIPNIRYLIPYYFAIFGAANGTRLVVVSTAMRLLVFSAVVGAIALIN